MTDYIIQYSTRPKGSPKTRGMPKDLRQLKHLKTVRARWPFPDVKA